MIIMKKYPFVNVHPCVCVSVCSAATFLGELQQQSHKVGTKGKKAGSKDFMLST